MTGNLQLCVDRWLDGESPYDLAQMGSNGRLAVLGDRLWEPGQVLRVHFVDGHPAVHAKVRAYAQQWCEYANLHFVFDAGPDAEIRISFDSSQGSWSCIGVDALAVPITQATMNFGWLSPKSSDEECARVILHEFGHAIGCVHEHQNPSTSIQWDVEAVYEYYAGKPNYWSRAQVDVNIFLLYGMSHTKYSTFDPGSIMLYHVPAELTTDGFTVGWNRALSSIDKQFISQVYPFH